MVQRVEVAGVGVVEFPDGMSREDMAAALSQLPAPEKKAEAAPTPAPAPAAKPVAAKPVPTPAPEPEIDPTTGKPYPELRARPEPTRWEQFWDWATSGVTESNKAKAANELAALRTAKERGITLNQAYRVTPQASRPLFNPEGRPTGTAAKEAATTAFKSLTGATTPMAREVEGEVNPITGLPEMPIPDIAASAINTYLRTARTGGPEEEDKDWLDRAITRTTVPPQKVDRNTEAFANLSQSLGYSAATMVASAIADAGGTAVAGPLGGIAAGAATSGAISYRASKDEFLSRLRDKLNENSEQTFGRKISADEWNRAKEQFDDAATQYGTWEAVPEAVTNLLFLKVFLAPISRTAGKVEKLAEYARRAAITEVPEHVGETATGLGQNIAERKAGLTKEELNLRDAFKQQFIQTLITSGTMATGAAAMQQANQFYQTYVEPRVRPGSALARAIQDDLETFVQREAGQRVAPRPAAGIYQPAPERGERPELTELQAARRPDLEQEPTTGPALSALEAARNQALEVGDQVQTNAADYERQGYAPDDARIMAERDAAAAARSNVYGRALQRQDIEDERRTAEGRAERAAMSMEAPSELPEPPSYVTQPSIDEYGTPVPSGAPRTAGGTTPAINRGLDIARAAAGQLDAREERERASLEANKQRLASMLSQAFNREALPDLGPILGASWTRSELAKNPTPEEYQDAAYVRLEELNGQRPDDAAPAIERGAAQPTKTKAEAPAATKPEVERTPLPDGGVRTVATKQGAGVIKDVTRYKYDLVVAGEPQQVVIERDNRTGETEAYFAVDGRTVGYGLQIKGFVAQGMEPLEAVKRVLPDVEQAKLTTPTTKKPAEAKAEAPAPVAKIRRPTDREKNNFFATAVIDFGPAGQAVLSEQQNDVYIQDKKGKELAVRQWDKRAGNISEASQFPAFVPESLRQPIIDYQDALYKSEDGKRETKIALNLARTKLQQAVAALSKPAETKAEAKPAAAKPAETTEERFAREEAEYKAREEAQEKRKAQIRQVVQANVDSAIDQVSDYKNAEDAAAAYRENVFDTLREQGIKLDDYELRYADQQFDKLLEERKRVAQAPKAVEAKEERPAQPAAKPAASAVAEEEAKLETLIKATEDKYTALEAAKETQKAAIAEYDKTPGSRSDDRSSPEYRKLEAVASAVAQAEREYQAAAQAEDKQYERFNAAKQESKAKPAKPAAPLELEAGRREDLEVEPPIVTEVKQAEQLLTKAGTPRIRAPGGGRKKSETAKTQEERTKQSGRLNKFNRDVATLIRLATEFGERQSLEAFQTPQEFEYKEAVRDMRADQLRTAIYGLSQRSGTAQGYIDAKDFVRKMPAALRDRAKALYEGTANIDDYHEIPPKPVELIEKERKSEEYKKARAEGKAQRDLEEQTIHSQLDEEEKQTVAEHYGSTSYDKVKDKFVADVIKAMNEGLDSVAEALRGIIRKLQSGLLAAVITLNSSFMTPPIPIAIPVETRTVQVRAEVPAEAAEFMSEGAKTAYSVLYPAFKDRMIKENKAFVITDKPTAISFIFNPDGSLILHTKTLLAEMFDDFYKGQVDKIRVNRITPAGLFTLGLRDAKRGVTEWGGDEWKTAHDYDFQKVFVLDKAIEGKASVTLMHSAWLKDKDADIRRAALKSKGAKDARLTHACINYDTNVYKFLLDNHQDQLDGAKIFIVPEDPKNTMSFINGEAVDKGDLRRERVEPVTATISEKVPQIPAKETGRAEEGILREQKKAPGKGLRRAMASRRRTSTEKFKAWFRKSVVRNDDGTPKVMYHGTARDIYEFRAKQAGATFVTESPRFAESFAGMSEDYMIRELANELDNDLDAKRALLVPLIDAAIESKDLGTDKNSRGLIKTTREQHIENYMRLALYRGMNTAGLGDALRNELKERLPSNQNIIPVYVSAQNPFDYENPEHLAVARKEYGKLFKEPFPTKNIQAGAWTTIESEHVQQAIKAAGFDGFYISEGPEKNLAVYNPNQLKSVFNAGEWSLVDNGILAAQRRSDKEKLFDLMRTQPEAKPGDAIRFNLPWVPGGYAVSGIVGNSIYMDKDGREVTADTPGAERYVNVTYKVDGEQITNPFEVETLRLNTLGFEQKFTGLTATYRKEQEELGLSEDDIYRIEQQLDMTPDPMFKQLTTLIGALSYITNSPNQLEAELAARLLQDDNIDSIEDTDFQVVETDTVDVDPEAKAMLDDDAAGVYIPYTDGGSVLVSGESYGEGQGINNEIVLHEAMHASGAKKITFVELAEKQNAPVPARLAEAVHQLRDLMNRARETYVRMKAEGSSAPNLDNLADAKAFTDIQEFYAYGLTDPDMKLFLRDEVPGISTKTTGFDRFVEIVMKLFGVDPSMKSGLKDLIMISHEIMKAKKPSDKKLAELARNDNIELINKAKRKQKNIQTAERDLEASRSPRAIIGNVGNVQSQARTPNMLSQFLERNLAGVNINTIKGVVHLMPTSSLLKIAIANGITSMETVKRQYSDRGAMRHRIHVEMDEIVGRWQKLKKKDELRLADTMHLSTDIAEDPSLPQGTRSRALANLWRQLTPQAKQLYKDVRDFYKKNMQSYLASTKQRIANSTLSGNINDPTTPKGQLYAEIVKTYEESIGKGPYFPLMREGTNWVAFGKGKDTNFQLFNSEKEMTEFIQKQLDERRKLGDKRDMRELVTAGEADYGYDINILRDKLAKENTSLKRVFSAIDSTNFGSASDIENLKREVFQMHLWLMPEQSMRRMFTPRKNRAGYSRDALRSFVVLGGRVANGVAGAYYNYKIRDALNASMSALKNNPDKAKLELVVKELQTRIEGSINPDYSPNVMDDVARFANKFTFMYLLTDMKQVFNNVWSLPSKGLPTLLKYFSIADIVKESAKFLSEGMVNQIGISRVDANGNVSYTMPSFGSSAVVRGNRELQYAVKMMEELEASGRGTVTTDVYFSEKNKATTTKGAVFNTVVHVTGALNQGSERITREMMYLTSYKLLRRQGVKPNEAVYRALDITQEALYRYAPDEVPPFMNKWGPKILFQLKKYSAFTVNFYMMNMAEATGKLPSKHRAGAVYATMGSYMMAIVGAGLGGAFGVSTMAWLLGLVHGWWEEYADETTRKTLGDLSPMKWFTEVYLPNEFGDMSVPGTDMKVSDILAHGLLNSLTESDLASSISEGSMWLQDLPGSLDINEILDSVSMRSMLGASAGVAHNILVSGAEDWARGDTSKALEKWMPIKMFRSPMIAHRLETEGLKDKDYNDVIKAREFKEGHIFMQALGFRPEAVVRIEDMNYFVKSQEYRISQDKQRLVDRWVQNTMRRNREGAKDVQQDINKFNRMYGYDDKLIIDADALDTALDNKLDEKENVVRGVSVLEKPEFDWLAKYRRESLRKVKENRPK